MWLEFLLNQMPDLHLAIEESAQMKVHFSILKGKNIGIRLSWRHVSVFRV